MAADIAAVGKKPLIAVSDATLGSALLAWDRFIEGDPASPWIAV